MYATTQTLLLIAFNAVFFFAPGRLLVESSAPRRIGLILCAVGLLVLMTALIALRRVIQVAPAPRAGGQLVTAGIYNVLRHPIYTAMVVLVIGLSLLRPTLATIAAGAIVIGFLLVKARFEESLLLAAYPDYAQYRARTRGVMLTRSKAPR